MNPLNYGSREACEKLFKAGIVLKTEFWWNKDETGKYYLIPYEKCHRNDGLQVLQVTPAVSMAEAWGELPPNTMIRKFGSDTWVWITDKEDSTRHNINPADALIELRIWLERRKDEN